MCPEAIWHPNVADTKITSAMPRNVILFDLITSIFDKSRAAAMTRRIQRAGAVSPETAPALNQIRRQRNHLQSDGIDS